MPKVNAPRFQTTRAEATEKPSLGDLRLDLHQETLIGLERVATLTNVWIDAAREHVDATAAYVETVLQSDEAPSVWDLFKDGLGFLTASHRRGARVLRAMTACLHTADPGPSPGAAGGSTVPAGVPVAVLLEVGHDAEASARPEPTAIPAGDISSIQIAGDLTRVGLANTIPMTNVRLTTSSRHSTVLVSLAGLGGATQAGVYLGSIVSRVTGTIVTQIVVVCR